MFQMICDTFQYKNHTLFQIHNKFEMIAIDSSLEGNDH